MNKAILIISTMLASLCINAQQPEYFDFGNDTNPNGISVKIDSHGFVIGGKPVIPVMGEIHFSRVPESDWQREICKMRAGGVTIIATYVFWNHHEEFEGQWDWTGNRNLRKFVETCSKENMPVVLRIGPWCHGECYEAGLPVWVVDKAQPAPLGKGLKLRSTAPEWLEMTKKLYNQIGEQVKGLMWKDGGPIIGIQLENESRGPWPYFQALKNMAQNAGLLPAFYTRTGWPAMTGKAEFGQILPLYGDYADGFWDRELTDMPGKYKDAFIFKSGRISEVIATEQFSKEDLKTNASDTTKTAGLSYPYLTCELGGGMMPSYHRRLNINGREMLPLAICKVGSGSSLPGYYMYHGGTNPYNPRHTMAETQSSRFTNHNDMPHMSYDFQTPLGEMGQINQTSFHQGRWFHQFLADWGEELSRFEPDSMSDHYAHRGDFIFRNDYVRIFHEKGISSVTPDNMKWQGLTISSNTIQPFAKLGNCLYFITIGNCKPDITINNKQYSLNIDRPLSIDGKQITVFSNEKAKTAFVIDGKMLFAKNGGILYKTGNQIVEECWQDVSSATFKLKKKAGKAREIPIGQKKVAAQPTDEDFSQAAYYSVKLPKSITKDCFMEVDYQGDVARVYADDQLVEDNFWNGKTFLVRISDLIGKKVEIKILPLVKNDKIYLQKEQQSILESAGGYLLSLNGLKIIERKTALNEN